MRCCGFDGVNVYVCVSGCFSMCGSSHGVCELGVGFVWLYMHIIDVSDDST